MDERFRETYQVLFDNYQVSNELPVGRGGLGMPPISALIRATINFVESEFAPRNRLRSDSKYFLLINFYSMIFMPLSLVGNIAPGEILDAVYSDIRQIVETAIRTTSENEISGHVVIDTVAKRWPDLKTTKFHLWGDQ